MNSCNVHGISKAQSLKKLISSTISDFTLCIVHQNSSKVEFRQKMKDEMWSNKPKCSTCLLFRRKINLISIVLW